MEGSAQDVPFKQDSQLLAFFIFFMVLCLQFMVQFWKSYHMRSYNITTLFLMWIFPFVLSFYFKFWRMISIWIIFSSVSLYMGFLATRKPLNLKTPRKVYSWFYYIYQIAHAVTLFGFALFLLDVFGVSEIIYRYIPLSTLLEYQIIKFFYMESLIMIFYGLYYSIIVRDCAELCAEKMASNLESSRNQFYTNENIIKRSCGVCSGGFESERDLEGFVKIHEEFINDNKLTLDCQHNFHEFCIKGWAIIGKKDYCPLCKEKVNIKERLSNNPWDTESKPWIQFLDLVRYIIVWNPLIIIILHVLLTVFKL